MSASSTSCVFPPYEALKPNEGIVTPSTRTARLPAGTRTAGQPAGVGFLASLGTTAKYSAELSTIDPETGEILGFEGKIDPMNFRVNRFALQSVAREALPDKLRIQACLRWRQKGQNVHVLRSKEFKTASYGGLQTCGSVWMCPVCSAKIAERRRAEIQSAMTLHKAQGGAVYLLTLTAPHQRKDKLSELLVKQSVALKYFFKDYTAKSVLQEMGIIGQIRALEVTHGRLSPQNNGWHPHYHFLLFAASNVDLEASAVRLSLSDRLYIRWAACCVRAGLGQPSLAHGLKLDDGNKAANYVSKWGLEDEMTKGHTKKALHGETPFDFLRSHLSDSTDKQALILFKEFAEAFHGKRQLHWSAGLKKRFLIGDFNDEELAARTDDFSELLGFITPEQWRTILNADCRGEVLQIASSGGWDAVQNFIEFLMKNEIKNSS